MSEVTHVDVGSYMLLPEDTPSTVARLVYGDVHKAPVLLHANPTSWDDLERVEVPNRKGRMTTVIDGESPSQTIQRMFPNQPVSIYLQPFFRWNGGQDFPPGPDEVVFVPER